MTKEHNSFMVIKDKDWENATSEQREWLIYNTLQAINDRLAKLESRSFYHQCAAFFGGIIGGIATVLGFKWFVE